MGEGSQHCLHCLHVSPLLCKLWGLTNALILMGSAEVRSKSVVRWGALVPDSETEV